MAVAISKALKLLLGWKRFLIIFLTPLLLCPIPIIINTKEAKTAYAILIMGTYWCTEVTNLAVTSLLPLFLFPVFKVMKYSDVAPSYFPDTNFLILGGLIMAVAIEKWNVHKRIALKALLLIGVQPRRLMLGFMLVTGFVSMWITNTATTAMITPIMEAVLKELDKKYIVEAINEADKHDTDNIDEEAAHAEGPSSLNMDDEERLKFKKNNNRTNEVIEFDDFASQPPSTVQSAKELIPRETNEEDGQVTAKVVDPKKKEHELVGKAMMLAICYAANIGGTGTLTGTGPNLVLSAVTASSFPKGPGMSFLDWFVFACPEMILFLLIAWLYLQVFFFGIQWKHLCFCFRGKKRNKTKGAETYVLMKKHYEDLGPITFAEIAVILHFLFMVLFWIFRDPKFINGWGSFFPVEDSPVKRSYVGDATAGIFVAFSLFVFPSVNKPGEALLTWEYMEKRFPWGILIWLGGGFALAKACDESGLSLWIGCQLTDLGSVSPFVIALVICIVISGLTEFTSNNATASILLPILASLARNIDIHPYYLMIPATICASFAFMLPVATPPNAIVFATGRLTIPDMVKAGIGMNIIGIIVVTLSLNTVGMAYFGLNEFPSWAEDITGAAKCSGAATILTTTITNMTTLLPTTNTTFF